MDNRIFKQFEVYYIEKHGEQVGSEQYPGRPAVVISDNKFNNGHTLSMAYLTTQPKPSSFVHVDTDCTGRRSTILLEQIFTVDKSRVKDYCGILNESETEELKRGIAEAFGLTGCCSNEESDDLCEEGYEIDFDTDCTSVNVAFERDFYKKQYEEILRRLIEK